MNESPLIYPAGGFCLQTQAGRIRVTVIDDAIVRITMTKRDTFVVGDSLMVLRQPPTDAKIEIVEDAEHILLMTRRLRLQVDRRTGAFTWMDGRGDLLVREPERGGKHQDVDGMLRVGEMLLPNADRHLCTSGVHRRRERPGLDPG